MPWIDGVVETNGIKIRYSRTGGPKPPVVMLHGLLGSGACWRPVARFLSEDVDVILPDARGHGDSSAPSGACRYDDLADDVVGLLCGLPLSLPVLVGRSMGGMTAAVVASRRVVPLRALVLVDPTFLRPERQREVYESDVVEQHRRSLALSKEALIAQAQARNPNRSPEIIELQVDARLKTSLDAFDVLRPPNPAYWEVVRAITVPTLLVVGDKPVVTRDIAEELCGMNPRVLVRELPNAGHGLPFEQPTRLAEAILSFLRGLA